MNQEVFEYLMNFWDHTIGSTVKTLDGEVFFISHINQDDKCQVALNDDVQYWYFIQDLTWFPSLKEAIKSVCEKIDISVYHDSIQYQRVIKPIPQSFEELYEAITDIRSYILSNN